MDLAQPFGLIGLAALPPLLLAVWVLRRRAARAWISLGKTGKPPFLRSWAWFVAILLLVVAACGPRWGIEPGSALPAGHDLVLLVDVSRSMAARDAVPDRLGAAVEAAEGLAEAVAGVDGERVAVVAFAGRGVLRCPLTENLGAVRDALHALKPGEVEPGGTNFAAALRAALDVFDDQEAADGRTIVVFSDGEDHENAWNQVLPQLRGSRVVVHAVAVGDPEKGHPVPVADRDLTYHGQPVSSRRVDPALDAIRKASGGAFVPMGLSTVDLGRLYRDTIAPASRRLRVAGRPPVRVDRSSLVVAVALAVLVFACWPVPRRARLLALLLVAGVGAGPVATTAARAVAEGAALYARGDFGPALAAFERAKSLDPAAPVANYDIAATLYQMGRFDAAEQHYRLAREGAPLALQAKVDYALGNLAAVRGEFREALIYYDACIRSSAPGLGRLRQDAGANRRYVALRVPPLPENESGGDRKAPSERKPRSRSSESSDDGSKSTGKSSEAGDPSAQPKGNPETAGPGTETPPQFPGERLNQMLDDLRKAQNRDAHSPRFPPASGDRKDW